MNTEDIKKLILWQIVWVISFSFILFSTKIKINVFMCNFLITLVKKKVMSVVRIEIKENRLKLYPCPDFRQIVCVCT